VNDKPLLTQYQNVSENDGGYEQEFIYRGVSLPR